MCVSGACLEQGSDAPLWVNGASILLALTLTLSRIRTLALTKSLTVTLTLTLTLAPTLALAPTLTLAQGAGYLLADGVSISTLEIDTRLCPTRRGGCVVEFAVPATGRLVFGVGLG